MSRLRQKCSSRDSNLGLETQISKSRSRVVESRLHLCVKVTACSDVVSEDVCIASVECCCDARCCMSAASAMSYGCFSCTVKHNTYIADVTQLSS